MTEKKNPIVVDTNIWIGHVVNLPGFENDKAAMVKLAASYHFAFTTETFQELEWMFTKSEKIKAHSDDSLREELLTLIRTEGLFYGVGEKIEGVSRDESDNRFLEAAVASGAKFIISNDFDLRDLKSYQGIEIVSSGEFLDLGSEE